MIIITGAAGFIGSCLVAAFNKEGMTDLVIVDDFGEQEKNQNLDGKKYAFKIERAEFLLWFQNHSAEVSFVYHLGARTDTTEFNRHLLYNLNTQYTIDIWQICTLNQIPLVYASSAATYGAGEMGYSDAHEVIPHLKPLNPYGDSKNTFDIWAIEQTNTPPRWVGLKFFNVYGPNEYHKGRMASVILHAYNQMNDRGSVKLFRSHKPAFNDGEQLRDFIYVMDVVNLLLWLLHNKIPNGIYNLGTGKARTFYDLAKATANAMHIPLQIDWIDIPEDIRETYQYFTEAEMQKLRAAGYTKPFYTLEDGIKAYVQQYLFEGRYY